jgi:hypothetical protein
MYIIIFGRIAESFQDVNREKRKSNKEDGIVCKEQKGFMKNINGSFEHNSKINFLVTQAMTIRKNFYIAALDCNDAFGSVSHQLLNVNLRKLEVPTKLRNL